MQVEIRLINDFHTTRPEVIESKATKTLTINNGKLIYKILNNILERLVDKDDEFWEQQDEAPDKLFKLVLTDENKTIDLTDDSDDWLVDWYPNEF